MKAKHKLEPIPVNTLFAAYKEVAEQRREKIAAQIAANEQIEMMSASQASLTSQLVEQVKFREYLKLEGALNKALIKKHVLERKKEDTAEVETEIQELEKQLAQIEQELLACDEEIEAPAVIAHQTKRFVSMLQKATKDKD